MDLFPRARRALLTAYADTDAAIAAINVVDVDHYLLKPWEPPEEKLYPVIDAMLDAYRPRRTPRCARPRWWATAGPPRRSRCATSWPATRCPTAGSSSTSRRGSGCWRPPASARTGCRWWSRRRERRWWRPPRPRWRPPSACRPHRRPTSTTSSSSAADRPVSAPPSTARRRGCAPCWSSGRRPAARPASRRGSRTTSASPTACPAPSSPTGPGGRRSSSAPRSSRRATSPALRADGPARVVRFGDGIEVAAHAVIIATGVSYRDLDAPGVGEPHRQRAVLRLRRDRGGRLRRRRRLHRRRRQLGRPGGRVLLPGGQVGDPGGPRATPRGQHVAVPDRAAAGDRQRRPSGSAPWWPRRTATATSRR